MSCGTTSMLKHQQNDKEKKEYYRLLMNAQIAVATVAKDNTVTAYSSYLGPVQLPADVLKGNNLVFKHTNSKGQDFRVIDAGKNRLDLEKNQFPLSYLRRLPRATISQQDNVGAYIVTLKLRELIARQRADVKDMQDVQKFLQKLPQPVNVNGMFLRQTFRDQTQYQHVLNVLNGRITTATATTMECYHTVLVINMAVDALFCNIMFAQFFGETFQHKFLSNMFLTVVNVKDLDNAYFTGSHLVLGNGKDMFLAMCSPDLCGHEIAHGVVQNTAGLEYMGESGALNEGMADILATGFESYLYKKLNQNQSTGDDILGVPDNLIGEDLMKKGRVLRDLEDPHNSSRPQPKTYKGQHWVDTTDTSEQNDYGGVHSNSGVINRAFVLLQKSIGMPAALRCFYKCLIGLSKNSGYLEAAQKLVDVSGSDAAAVAMCLSQCGLQTRVPPTVPDDVESDDTKSDEPLEDGEICSCECCSHVCEKVRNRKRRRRGAASSHPYKRKRCRRPRRHPLNRW
jgi:hypothetical protein